MLTAMIGIHDKATKVNLSTLDLKKNQIKRHRITCKVGE